jgi:phosphoribosylformimino-5-aminoimidazole carboxamide ribotide isomerase
VLRAVREAVSCRLQVGGGIRSEADVEALLEAGADRLLLGTVLAREPRRVESWCARYGAVFAAAIDARRGRVMVSGWREDGALEDMELGRRAAGLGVQAIVYTSIDRDGTLSGPDLERTIRVAAAAGLPVILSGGIGGEADVEAVWRLRERGLRGVVIGKALYEGRVALAELLRRYDRAAGEDSR